MIQNLDHKSKKTRETLREYTLNTTDIKKLTTTNPKQIFWVYDPQADRYYKTTAIEEDGKIKLIDQNKNIVQDMSEETSNVVFEDKKMMLSYQRAPEKKKKTKKDLLRNALGQEGLKQLLSEGRTNVWGFNEMEQTYDKYKIVKEEGSVVLKNKNNETEKFIDAIFKSEYEVKQYSETTFM